jgi:hypothetical protein
MENLLKKLEEEIIKLDKEHLLELIEIIREELDPDWEPDSDWEEPPEEYFIGLSPHEEIIFDIDEEGFHYLVED